MKIGLEYFYWSRFEGGYEWRDAKAVPDDQEVEGIDDRRFLVPRAVEAGTLRTHPLVHQPTLFKTFAALEPTEASFSGFANQHGLLGVDVLLQIPGPLEKAIGEPFSLWRHEWARIRRVVHLLNAIETGDAKTLEQCVTVTERSARLHLEMGDGFKVFAGIATAGDIANPFTLRQELWEYALRGKTRTELLARFASGWVQAAVNDSIDASRLQGAAAVPAQVLFDAEKQRLTLHLVPQSLLAALWLQCARVLTEHPTFKQCERCGKWFELSADARRRQSKYCEARCKVAAYRLRKAEAEQKKPSGRSRTTGMGTLKTNKGKRLNHGKTTRTR